MIRHFLPMLAAATLAAGAATPAFSVMPITPRLNPRLGETMTIGGYRVTPVAVLEDSRCPATVACVWSGQVRLRVRIAAVNGTERFNGEMTSIRPLQLRRGTLRIGAIYPRKTTTGSPRPEEYRFNFQFTANPPGHNTRLS